VNLNDAKDSIIKWVDTQITFNPYNISQNETTDFFKAWQNRYYPEHSYVEIHTTQNPNAVYFAWTVYLCTSSERFKQYGKTLFDADNQLDVLWADYIIKTKNNIIFIKITADSVNNISVIIE